MDYFATEGFYFFYGLIGALGLVFIPKVLGTFLLNRPTDYYGDEEEL